MVKKIKNQKVKIGTIKEGNPLKKIFKSNSKKPTIEFKGSGEPVNLWR